MTAADRPSVTDNARAAIRALAQHQFAEPLPFGVVCTCGEDIGEWNRPSWPASISGRALAFAAHQFERMHAATEPYDPECVGCQGTGMATLNPDEEPGSHSCRRAAGRAETTTATIERLRDAIERVPKVGPNAIYEAELLSVLREARDALLATARTRPTREAIREALSAWDDADAYDAADAVLALLADQPDHAAIEAELRARLAGQYTAKAAHARTSTAAFTWQQAARIAGGDDQ